MGVQELGREIEGEGGRCCELRTDICPVHFVSINPSSSRWRYALIAGCADDGKITANSR
jgi:hypothetical protein